jgi:glucokinase
MVVLALDIGGTQIRVAAILPTGPGSGARAGPTPLSDGAEAIYRACAGMLRGTADDLPAEVRRRVAAIGISSMGPVDPWRGLVVDPPNVACLRDAPLADEMEARLGLPAFLERDTNVAALAENWLGAAAAARFPVRDRLDGPGRGRRPSRAAWCWAPTARPASWAT